MTNPPPTPRTSTPTAPTTSDTNGQSHTVGFLILLAIFTIGGLSLFVTSFALFNDSPQSKSFTAGQQDMDKLQQTFNSLDATDSYRKVTLTNVPATLRHTDPVTITVNATATAGGTDEAPPDCTSDWCQLGQVTTEPLTYETGAGNLSYVGGALLIAQDSGTYLSSPGMWSLTDSRSHLTLYETRHARGPESVAMSGGGSTGSLYIAGSHIDRSSQYWLPRTDSGTPGELRVRFTINNTPHATAWAQYFERHHKTTVAHQTATSVQAEFTTRHLLARTVTVNTELRT